MVSGDNWIIIIIMGSQENLTENLKLQCNDSYKTREDHTAYGNDKSIIRETN